MNQINDMPPDYGFGLGFDYAVWTANTNITLTNVPWNSDYRDVWDYSDNKELNDYIDRSFSHNVNISNSVYAKISEPIVIDQPFNVASQFNYVRVYNPSQPISGNDKPKYFYYFIVDVIYSAPNATSIIVQLDVWATYIKQIQFGRAYIESGHIGIANEKQWNGYGREYLTTPEGLDIGANYRVIDQVERKLIKNDNYTDGGGIGKSVGWSVLVTATVDLTANPGTIRDPNVTTARGGESLGLVSGADQYIFKTMNDFRNFMANYAQYPWVTRSILSATLIPSHKRLWTNIGSPLPFGGYKAPASRPAMFPDTISSVPFRNRENVINAIPNRYRHLKKFFTFPYFAIRISSNSGQQVVLQPEQWNSENGDIIEMSSVIAPNAKYGIFPDNYGTSLTRKDATAPPSGAGFDYGVYITGLPSIPMVNDGAALYMAQNAHSIAFGYQSADWSQQRALRGNEATYDNQTSGINASTEITRIGQNSDMVSHEISKGLANDTAMLNMIRSTTGGAVGGSTGGAAGMAVGAGMGAADGLAGLLQNSWNMAAADNQLSNRLSSGTRAHDVGRANAMGVRDTNKSLSDWAARGDYQNTIAAMNAKTRDAELTPPSVIGGQGGETFNLVNNNLGWRIDYLMPEQGAINSIGEYWLRYGYSVQRFEAMPNTLSVMTHFSYWKLKECYIRAVRLPEWVKQSIRGILEKGVTVWRNPDDIGMIDPAENRPVPGFSLEGYVPPKPEPEKPIEPPKPQNRRKHKMLVYSTIDETPATPGNVWALAGSSPGSTANWIETRSVARANSFLQATGQVNPVGLSFAEFAQYRDNYSGPVSTMEIVGEVG